MKITPPTNCPGCNSKLEWKNHILYCLNPMCGEQAQKKLEHFAKSLKIKGLGPATIKRLELSNFHDLYELTEESLEEKLQSVKLAEKLFKEIENSKKAPAEMLIPAFSIRLVGKTASGKLAKVCKNIDSINDETCKRAGLGEKTTANLMSWKNTVFPLIKDLPLNFEFTDKPEVVTTKSDVVCITGRLVSFKTKSEATKALEAEGFLVKSSLTKDVTILVNESGISSSKTQKAIDNGIKIVTDIRTLIGD